MARPAGSERPQPSTADAGVRASRSWSFARLRPSRPRADQGESSSAIPAREYSADERAERARGAVIAFLIVAAAVVAIPVVLLALWLF
jgi:hypothetical protein